MAETVEEAIYEAKVAAGLDPEQKYPSYRFAGHMEERWSRPFCELVLDQVIAAYPVLHDFLPVNGHPDDDECTFRADGTDATYCGRTRDAHGYAPAVPGGEA